MKEGIQVTDRWEIQKDDLSRSKNIHERIVPIIMRVPQHEWRNGHKVLTGLNGIAAGYVIVDRQFTDENIVLTEAPEHYVSVEWQGEQLANKMKKWATISPVKKIIDPNTERQREVIAGWRIHTEDALSGEAKKNARDALVTALSERADEAELRRCSDAELCLMMLLMLNNDTGLVREMIDHHDIEDRRVKGPVRAMIGDMREAIAYEYAHRNDGFGGHNPI